MSENNENMESMEDLDKMFEELDAIEGETSLDNDGSRDPISEVSGISKAALNTLTKPEEVLKTVGETISNSLPNPIQKELDTAKELHEQILEPIATGLKQARRASSNIVNTIADILPEVPGVNSTLRKIADAIKPEEKETTRSSEPSEDEIIKNNIAEVFGESTPEERTKERLEEVQDLSDLELTIRNVKNLEVMKDYFLNDHYKYLKKSLELQFKQTLALIDLRNRFGVFHKENIELLKAITKNTSLPDIVKMENKEILEHKIKDKLFSKGINLFTNNSFIKRLKEGITDTVLNKIEYMSSMAEGTSAQLEMVKELSGQLTPQARREMAGEIIASFLIGSVTSKVFDKIKKSDKGNKLFGSAGKAIQKTVKDPTRFFDKVVPEKVKETYWFNEFRDILKSAKEESSIESINFKEDNLNQSVPFDLQTKKSITAVIPGLLSKIVNELKAIRTGKYDEDNELVFDYSKNKFVKRKQLKEDLITELKDIKNRFSESTKSVSQTLLYYLLGNNYTPRDLESFKRGLEHMILEGKSLDIYDWYEDKSMLKYFNSNVRKRIEQGVKKLVESKDMDSMRIISNIDSYLKSLKQQANITSEKLDIIKNNGLMEELEDLGIVKKDSTTIEKEKVRELLTKDIEFEKKPFKNIKKTTKYKIPKIDKNEIKEISPVIKTNLTPVTNTITSISNKLNNKLSSIVKLLSDIKEIIKNNTKTKNCDICEFLKELPKISRFTTTINNTIRNIGNSIVKSLNKIKTTNNNIINGIKNKVKKDDIIEAEIVKEKSNTKSIIPYGIKTLQPVPVLNNLPLSKAFTINNATLTINNATITGLNNVLTDMSKSITGIIDTNIGKNLVDKLNKTYESITTKSLEDYKNMLSLTNIKEQSLNKISELSTKIKNNELSKNINTKIETQINKIKSSAVYKNAEEKLSKVKTTLKDRIETKFKDRMVVIEEPNENGEIEKNYLIEVGKHTLIIPAIALTSPKLLFDTIKSQVSKEEAIEIMKELTPSKKDIKDKITGTADTVWSTVLNKKKEIKEKGIFNFLKEEKDKAFNFIKNKTDNKKLSDIIEKIKMPDNIQEGMSNIDLYDKLPDSIKQLVTKDENGDFIITINDEIFKVNKEGLMKLLPVIKDKIENGTINLKDKGLNKLTEIKNKIEQTGIGGALLDMASDIRKSIMNTLRDHKGLPKELLKQMFGGKDPFKDNISILDMMKAFTFGTLKSSFWFGRNVVRPGYKRILSGVGQIAHNTAVTILTKAFGFDPRIAEAVVGLIEAPFKLVGKALGGVNTIIKKTKEAFQGLFNIVGKLGRLFLSKTWQLVKKGLGFLTGRTEDEIQAGVNLYKNKVKQTGKKLHDKWIDVENSGLLTKTLMSPIRHITRTGINLPGNILKFGKGLANTFIITNKEEENLWLNRRLKGLNDVSSNIKNKVVEGIQGLHTRGNVRKYIDKDGRVVIETDVTTKQPVVNNNKVNIETNEVNEEPKIKNRRLRLPRINKLFSLSKIFNPDKNSKIEVRSVDKDSNKTSLFNKVKSSMLNKINRTKAIDNDEDNEIKTERLTKLISELETRLNKGKIPNSTLDILRSMLSLSRNEIDKLKPSSKDNLIKILEEHLDKENGVEKREEKIKELRDSVKKDKEDGKLIENKKSSNTSLLGILGIAVGILKKIFSGITKLGNFFFRWIPKLFTGLKGLGKFIVENLGKTISGLSKFVVKGMSSVIHGGVKVAKYIKDKFTKTNIIDDVESDKETSFFGKLWDKAKNTVGKVWNKTKEITGKIVDTVKKRAGRVFESAEDIVSHAWGSVKEAVSHLVDTPFVKNLVKKVKNVIPVIRKKLFKKFGEKEATRIIADVGADLMPGINIAFLMWDAANIAWDMLHNHTPFLSAVSKQLIGIDLFKDDDKKKQLINTVKKDNEKIRNKAEELTKIKTIKPKDNVIEPITITKTKDLTEHIDKKPKINIHKPTPVIVNNHLDDKHTKALHQIQISLVELSSKQVDLQTEINENLKTLTNLFLDKFGKDKNKNKSRSSRSHIRNYKTIPTPLPKPAVTAYSTDL